MKLCFAASSGGHLEEIMCLHNIVCNHESFLLTEKLTKFLIIFS